MKPSRLFPNMPVSSDLGGVLARSRWLQCLQLTEEDRNARALLGVHSHHRGQKLPQSCRMPVGVEAEDWRTPTTAKIPTWLALGKSLQCLVSLLLLTWGFVGC